MRLPAVLLCLLGFVALPPPNARRRPSSMSASVGTTSGTFPSLYGACALPMLPAPTPTLPTSSSSEGSDAYVATRRGERPHRVPKTDVSGSAKDSHHKSGSLKSSGHHGSRDKTGRHQTRVLSSGGSRKSRTKDNQEDTILVNILVEMQKRTEEKVGFTHTQEEEGEVDTFFEDDIRLTVFQAEQLLQDLSRRPKRKLAEPLSKRWPLPILYSFDGSHSLVERGKIRMALEYWQELTCVTFRESPKASNKLLFVKGRGCWSYVGYTHQVNQTISIGEGCQSNGTIAHEVGHAIGFWHEQSRPDRDEHILIHRHNVTDGKLYNFAKRTWGEIVTLNVPYDLGSDMHYGSKFYAKDPNSTLTTVQTRDPLMARVIGQRQELSFYDVKLANMAYCDGLCTSRGLRLPQPCLRDGYQDPKACHRCRCPDGFGGTYCETVTPGKNAYCGGVLFAANNGTISSPGYPLTPYRPDQSCSWLIKAPTGMHVYLETVGTFGMAGHLDVCKDYLEVRYNSSLALTGARFCLSDPPRHPIKSDSNEMLVLFRSFAESRVCDDLKYPWKCRLIYTGFRARYYTQSCGGCGNYHGSEQPACVRRISYPCAHSWQEKVKVRCTSSWWYPESCGPKLVTRVRYATCFRDEFYCCDHFLLSDKTCKAGSSAQKRSSSNEATIGSRPIAHAPATKFNVTHAWLEWSPWGRCSRSCGGGVRARTRRCSEHGACGDRDLEIQREPCALSVCYRVCKATREELCDFWYSCKKTFYHICEVYCSEGFRRAGERCRSLGV